MTPSLVPSEFSPELAGVAVALEKQGITRADCVGVVRSISYQSDGHAEIAGWKNRLHSAGIDTGMDLLERVVITCAANDSLPRVDSLRVHSAVKASIRKEFQSFARPGRQALTIDTDLFITAAMIATLRRFPAGPMDWVTSGFPRSWLRQISLPNLPRALSYILFHFGGFRPAFYVHLAHPPRNRALVIEKEVRRAYYRMARSLMLQPQMKGIMTAAWFHDPVALREFPHLAALNEPYLQHGGRIVASLEQAGEESGFLKFNSDRRKLVEEGKLRIRITLAMWPRAEAIHWAEQHPELDS